MACWPGAKSAKVPTECLSGEKEGEGCGGKRNPRGGDYRSFFKKRNGSIGRCRSAPNRAMLASSARSCGPNHERGVGSASVSQTMLTKSAQSIVDPTLPPEDGCRNRENCPCGAHLGRRSPWTYLSSVTVTACPTVRRRRSSRSPCARHRRRTVGARTPYACPCSS